MLRKPQHWKLTLPGRCESEQRDGREGEGEGTTECWTAGDQEVRQEVEDRKESTEIYVTRQAGVADLGVRYHKMRLALDTELENSVAR